MTSKTRYFMGGSAAILVAGLGTGLVAYYGGGFPSLSASRSGPSELSYVPADAAVVAYANVREVMDSQLRQRLKIVMPQEQGQQEFQRETGIDIEKDIDYVVAAHSGSEPDVEGVPPLLLARLQGGNQAGIADFMNSLQLGGQGNTVSLTFSVPPAVIDALGAMRAQQRPGFKLPPEPPVPPPPTAPDAPRPPAPPAL
jgi:hypothetical protein